MQVRGSPLAGSALKEAVGNGSEIAAQRQMIAVERVKRGASSNAGETSGSKALETRFAKCFLREQTSSNEICHP